MNNTKTAAALGIFDGVHLGHRAVLAAAAEQKKNGLSPNVFTFAPELTALKGAEGFIYTESEKKTVILEECGIENIFSAEFEKICGMDGETFVKNILCGEMNVGFVSCGSNFHFGKNASCGVSELSEFGKKYGFEVRVVSDVLCGNCKVSSTSIRELLAAGNVNRAAEFLGTPYMILKTVEHGAEIGRTIGFPTANQFFAKGQLVPSFGVYASRTSVNGKTYRSMTNIGIKPTVSYGGSPLAETYIDGFSGDIYGQTIKVELLDFLRPEKKFSSLEELKKQISDDIANAVKR